MRDAIGIDASVDEKGVRISDVVDSRELDGRFLEAGLLEEADEFIIRQRAGHATDPELHAALHVRWQLALNNDVGNRESSTGLEYAKCLFDDASFVTGEIHDAIGDDDVDGFRGQRNLLDASAQEFDVRYSGLRGVLPSERKHVVGHIETIRPSSGTHAAR